MVCPKCKEEMTWGYTWIQHGDIGHPGPQTWLCKCGYVEPIKPTMPLEFNCGESKPVN